MYLSIRRYPSSNPAEVTKRVQAGFVPLLQTIPGFVAYYVVDSGPNTWTSINVFESREGAEQSNQLAAQWAPGNVGAHLTGKPEITVGPVSIHASRS